MAEDTPLYKTYTDLDLPDAVFEPLVFTRYAEPEMRKRAKDFYEEMNGRRTTRQFSKEPVPKELIELAIRTAGTARVRQQYRISICPACTCTENAWSKSHQLIWIAARLRQTLDLGGCERFSNVCVLCLQGRVLGLNRDGLAYHACLE